MSYNYTQFVAELANLAGTVSNNQFFAIELPNAIDYAEQRLFRDLDLTATEIIQRGVFASIGSRGLAVPSNFIAITGLAYITGAQDLHRLTPCSLAVLDALWPSVQPAGPPRLYNYFSQGFGANKGLVSLGPYPDLPYEFSVVGTARPAPLTSTNVATFLTTYLPDLFLVAAMIHMCAYQKNWAATANDPNASLTWETQYAKLLASANVEQMRVRYAGSIVEPPHGSLAQAG